MDKDTILAILSREKDNFNIKQFVLFGSFSTDTSHPNSDIDVAYILKDGSKMTFDSYLSLEQRLANSLNAKVDLMNFKKLNPLIRLNAEKNFIYV